MFDVSMLIADIIKALMSILSPALLLPHLFNPEHYRPYGALTSLKNSLFQRPSGFMRPLHLLNSQLFHLSVLPAITPKYLRGVIKVVLLFEDF